MSVIIFLCGLFCITYFIFRCFPVDLMQTCYYFIKFVHLYIFSNLHIYKKYIHSLEKKSFTHTYVHTHCVQERMKKERRRREKSERVKRRERESKRARDQENRREKEREKEEGMERREKEREKSGERGHARVCICVCDSYIELLIQLEHTLNFLIF